MNYLLIIIVIVILSICSVSSCISSLGAYYMYNKKSSSETVIDNVNAGDNIIDINGQPVILTELGASGECGEDEKILANDIFQRMLELNNVEDITFQYLDMKKKSGDNKEKVCSVYYKINNKGDIKDQWMEFNMINEGGWKVKEIYSPDDNAILYSMENDKRIKSKR